MSELISIPLANRRPIYTLSIIEAEDVVCELLGIPPMQHAPAQLHQAVRDRLASFGHYFTVTHNPNLAKLEPHRRWSCIVLHPATFLTLAMQYAATEELAVAYAVLELNHYRAAISGSPPQGVTDIPQGDAPMFEGSNAAMQDELPEHTEPTGDTESPATTDVAAPVSGAPDEALAPSEDPEDTATREGEAPSEPVTNGASDGTAQDTPEPQAITATEATMEGTPQDGVQVDANDMPPASYLPNGDPLTNGAPEVSAPDTNVVSNDHASEPAAEETGAIEGGTDPSTD